MARKVRVEFPGAVYHVTARGNERVRIFYGKADCELFLKTLETGLQQFEVKLRAYCLMPNHFHLVVETPLANLSRFMAWLQTTFTVRFNRRRLRSGHLFHGRYRAEIIDSSTYGKCLLLYVHLNPVRSRKLKEVSYHGGLQELEAFRWSSHRVYAGLAAASIQGLDTSWLSEWGRSQRLAQQRYRKAIKTELGARDAFDWKIQLSMGLVAGENALLAKVKRLLSGKGRKVGAKEIKKLEKQGRHQRLQPLLEKEEDERVRVWARVRLLGERPVDLARERGYRDGGSILQIVKRMEARIKRNKNLKEKVFHLTKLSRADD